MRTKNSIKNNNPVLLLLGVVLVIMFFILSIFLFLKESFFNTQVNTISIQGEPESQGLENYQYLEDQSRFRIEKVFELRKKLPHNGKNFSLSYDFDSNTYTLVLNKSKISDGYNELDSFLRENDILSRTWVPDLVIVVK